MANKFGEAALIAARLDVPASVSATDRWDTAVRQLYPEKPYMQKKTAPRGAFLGLCEEGLVKGIAPGQYVASNVNKRYALRAVALLKEGRPCTISALWAHAVEGQETPHNAQMDVVLALWKNGLIV